MKRTLALLTIAAFSLSASAFADSKKYIIVLKHQNLIPAAMDKAVQDAGGTITTRLPQIGSLGAESANPNFAALMAADKNVEEVAEDLMFQMIPTPEKMNLQPAPASTVESPGPDTQTGPDPFYAPYQWDKKRIRASNQGSYPIQQGRPDVIVAVLDTGAQVLPNPHPDIVPNLDFGLSRSFVAPAPPGGDPAPSAWDDRNGHGSHTISNVGAPGSNGGMVGVAPKVKLVSLKVLSDTGSGSYLWLAQALVYAGINKFDVASMSLGGYLLRHDPDQKVLIKLVQRAVNFARGNGVTPVAALGNEGFDLSDGAFMDNYLEVPGEIDGVIGVSATDYFNNKPPYSNYGVGKTDVSAPGGEFNGPPPHFGLVIGAWASDSIVLPANYVLASGTSMACPNAAGVCALIISQYGDFTTNGNGRKTHMNPQQVESILQQTANNQPCPAATTCDGGDGYSNYFGKGIVDALKAVTK